MIKKQKTKNTNTVKIHRVTYADIIWYLSLSSYPEDLNWKLVDQHQCYEF